VLPAASSPDQNLASPGNGLCFVGDGRSLDEFFFSRREGDLHGIGPPFCGRFGGATSHANKYRYKKTLVNATFLLTRRIYYGYIKYVVRDAGAVGDEVERMRNRNRDIFRLHKRKRGIMGMGYRGWRNYETWSVHRWLISDKGRSEYWKERGLRTPEDSNDSPDVRDKNALIKDVTRKQLAEELQAKLRAICFSDLDEVYAELLGAALERVDWAEIAASFRPRYRSSSPRDADLPVPAAAFEVEESE
jgi:hypothetical protein